MPSSWTSDHGSNPSLLLLLEEDGSTLKCQTRRRRARRRELTSTFPALGSWHSESRRSSRLGCTCIRLIRIVGGRFLRFFFVFLKLPPLYGPLFVLGCTCLLFRFCSFGCHLPFPCR